MTATEFDRWYWPVDALKAFCEALDIPATGTKATLRDRVAAALSGAPLPKAPKRSGTSTFNWAKADLTPDTVITDTVSFGPNVRGYFKSRIGPKFSCHGDFMDWMRSNTGATLADAEQAWHMLEARKDDPTFRREIATCNNYLQYLRDARDAHPDLTLEQAKACWDAKKIQPAPGGYVRFETVDLTALSRENS
ncbi:DUF6434 domain-containing protein [Tateyamaria omphalii]|uniref:DUF6434 domain-containing protein n=1 Tax=Tateyamaria omphalii TaxID=299262 RepID=A0A1P8MZG4_9RHOB|nr:DUF6434 domain-containing protein [Tateyamaria omphalii]APX13382.1 hypothetical protein BWR18_18110 [Tateyamaria omphalii]